MFQSALIRPHGTGNHLVDVGTIAETLVFYGKVNVFANYGMLFDIIRLIGTDRFITLLEENFINVTYSRYFDTMLCHSNNYVTGYKFMSITNSDVGGKKIKPKDDIKKIISIIDGENKNSRKQTDKIIKKLKFRGGLIDTTQKASDIAHQELDDINYLQKSVVIILSRLVPNYNIPADLEFRAVYNGDEIFIITNLEFTKINSYYLLLNPDSREPISVERILLSLLETRIDIDLSIEYMSELVTREANSDMIRLKHKIMLDRRDKSAKEIDGFQEITLGDGKAIREALNSGEREFSEFMPVLTKSTKFKHWLDAQNPDAVLLQEYYRSVTAGSWISSLPAKSIRYMLTAAIGIIDPVSGLAAAAADEFVVDRLFEGWKPSHFVNGPLKKFTG